MEGKLCRGEKFYLWVDDYVEIDGYTLTLVQLFRREGLVVLGFIFDHRNLKRFSNLWGGDPLPEHHASCRACNQSGSGCRGCGSPPPIDDAQPSVARDCQLHRF